MHRIEEPARTTSPARPPLFSPRPARVAATFPADEEMFVDDRCAIGPAQMVEEKLARILKDSMVPVSHLLLRKLLRAR